MVVPAGVPHGGVQRGQTHSPAGPVVWKEQRRMPGAGPRGGGLAPTGWRRRSSLFGGGGGPAAVGGRVRAVGGQLWVWSPEQGPLGGAGTGV